MITIQAKAQNMNATTQNSTGVSGNSTNGFNLTYSVGELASIASFTAANNYNLNTGFLQTFTPLITALNDLVLLEAGVVSVYPNPTTQFIQIHANFNTIGQVQMQLMNSVSAIKYRSESIAILNQFNKQLNMVEYAPGVYYLSIRFQPFEGLPRVGIYKIVKL